MNLNKKLGVWKVDNISRKDNKIHAEDYYCVGCFNDGKKVQAETFWEPIMDSNIGLKPYCKPCLKKLKEGIVRDYWLHIMNNPLEKNGK